MNRKLRVTVATAVMGMLAFTTGCPRRPRTPPPDPVPGEPADDVPGADPPMIPPADPDDPDVGKPPSS